MFWFLAIALLVEIVSAISDGLAAELGYPAGVDVWCGKAYRATNTSFNPGGWLDAPALSSSPLLDLSIRPRMNLYLASEKYASFVIDAPISYIHGSSYTNGSFNEDTNITSPFTQLFIDVSVVESGIDLISSSNVTINTTNNEMGFSLAKLTPRFDPYEIVITGASDDGSQFYTSTTNLFYIPDRNDTGSVVKVDNLYGGLAIQNHLSNSTAWTPLFPYTYYVSWDGWLALSTDNVKLFKDEGYNIIHIVPNEALANEAFNFTQLDTFLDIMDELELWLMFDMRWTYMNFTSVETQVNLIKNRKCMLLWYTGDEPDGQVDPLNATKITYDLIKSIDPYHPVSLCLNCHNYYFANYSSGADIIMSDPYPIAVNTSFSNQYDTVCNTTYGCCGCDDCNGDFEDVSDRLDTFSTYQTWLGGPQKPLWGVPQAFGNATFWARYPSPEEEVVMNMLFVNHGAKGIAMWDYPTTPDINNVTSLLSKTLTSTTITGFLLGGFGQELEVSGLQRVDAAAWMVDGKMLVSVVNMNYVGSGVNVSIVLPAAMSTVSSVMWGDSWSVSGDVLWRNGLSELDVDILILS